MKISKKTVLTYAAIANIIIWAAFIINIIFVYPLTLDNAWIYGFAIFMAGFITYILGLLREEGFKIELIGTGIILGAGILFIAYFSFENYAYVFGNASLGNAFPWALKYPWALWYSAYTLFITCAFFVLMVVAYFLGSGDLPNRQIINWALMLVSGSFFLLMIEIANHETTFIKSSPNVPLWAAIIMVGGALLYIFTTWKIFAEKPSYVMSLTGAFIINVGILLLEMYFQIAEITKIFTFILLPPAAVFLLLIYINYKVSPQD